MSGPKVVRVVSREELVAQCEGALARLDRCLVLWRQELECMGRLTDSGDRQASDRRQKLDAALREDRFAEVLRLASAEVSFLETEIEVHRAKFAEMQAMEMGRIESARTTARAVAQALAKSGTADAQLLSALQEVGSGKRTLAEADAILARAFASRKSSSAVELSETQKAHAARLGSGLSEESLQDWKARHAGRDERRDSVLRLIAEVGALAPGVELAFQARCSEVLRQDDDQARGLRLDSLMLDLQAQRSALQRLAGLRHEAELLSAELEKQADEALLGAAQRIRSNLDDARQLEVTLGEVRAELDATRKRQAADARRKAVLQGLASLGYTTAEGMGTGLAEAGRLVLHNADMPGYGVEIVGGGEQSERLQVRAVALARSRDTTKDIAAETKWCSDFTGLREMLAAAGIQVVIEKALPVGSQPLRVVEVDGAEEQRVRRDTGTPQQRAKPGGAH